MIKSLFKNIMNRKADRPGRILNVFRIAGAHSAERFAGVREPDASGPDMMNLES